MSQVAKGNTVKIHYTGTLEDGTVFDSTKGKAPFVFTLGKAMVIEGFENAVIGMSVGDKKSVLIEASKAYGDYKTELVIEVDKANVPPDIDLKTGMTMQVPTRQKDQFISVVIAEIKENTVVMDGNHPLSGKSLNFELELVEIV